MTDNTTATLNEDDVPVITLDLPATAVELICFLIRLNFGDPDCVAAVNEGYQLTEKGTDNLVLALTKLEMAVEKVTDSDGNYKKSEAEAK